MANIKTINFELFKSIHLDGDGIKYLKLWNQIKYDRSILKEAISVEKGKNNQDYIKYPVIAESMLINSTDVDQTSYDELIELVFSNSAVARTYIDGKKKGCFSFLLIALWNKKLELTKEQKGFAVIEAIKKIQEDIIQEYPYAKELNIDLSKTAIVHGISPYDLRYYILKNDNWTYLEKVDLISKFWKTDEEFKEYIETLENEILSKIGNSGRRFSDNILQNIIYAYSYYDLLEITNNEALTKELLKEIVFCRHLHDLLHLKKAKEKVWWNHQ